MKKIWLMGGLGNVFFQILAFNVLHKKTNEKIVFIPYLTEKNLITKLIKWSIHDQLFYHFIDKENVLKPNSIEAFKSILLGFFSKMTGFSFNYATFYQNKRRIHRNHVSNNIFGYFQEKEFLKDNEDDLRNLGKFIRNKLGVSTNNLIIVHYRKGDSSWAKASEIYYDKVKEELIKSSEKALVVTDSRNEASNFFKDLPNVAIAKSDSAFEDFKLMVQAEKLYCAPSTFSWWASHTLPEHCKVVAPEFLDELLGFYTKCSVTII